MAVKQSTAIAGPFRKREVARQVERDLSGRLSGRQIVSSKAGEITVYSAQTGKHYVVPHWTRGFAVRRIGFGKASPGATRRERWSVQWEVIATSWPSK